MTTAMNQAREMELQLEIDRLNREKIATRLVLEWHFRDGRSNRPPPSDWRLAPEYLQKMLGLSEGSAD